MCYCILGGRERERCWAQKEGEEDIIADFPPHLLYLKLTQLVFLRFPHKAALVCPETGTSDMGKSVMVD